MLPKGPADAGVKKTGNKNKVRATVMMRVIVASPSSPVRREELPRDPAGSDPVILGSGKVPRHIAARRPPEFFQFARIGRVSRDLSGKCHNLAILFRYPGFFPRPLGQRDPLGERSGRSIADVSCWLIQGFNSRTRTMTAFEPCQISN